MSELGRWRVHGWDLDEDSATFEFEGGKTVHCQADELDVDAYIEFICDEHDALALLPGVRSEPCDDGERLVWDGEHPGPWRGADDFPAWARADRDAAEIATLRAEVERLTRDLSALDGQLVLTTEDLVTRTTERDAALATIERVRRLGDPDSDAVYEECFYDGPSVEWNTVLAALAEPK